MNTYVNIFNVLKLSYVSPIFLSLFPFIFEGYTDPSVMKYYNLKHRDEGIKFYCLENAFDSCGQQNYQCNNNGLLLAYNYSGFQSNITLSYQTTTKDVYFAPYFYMNVMTNEWLWPYSMNPQKVSYAQSILSQLSTIANVIKIRNPIFALYPGYNSNDQDYSKHIHAENRIFNGMPYLFNTAEDTLNTGRKDIKSTLNIEKYRGNTTIMHIPQNSLITVQGSTAKNQYPMFLWSGYENYSYIYLGALNGINFNTQDYLYLFSKQTAIAFRLSQNSLTIDTNKKLSLNIPLNDEYCYYKSTSCERSGLLKILNITIRHFVDDYNTWENLRSLSNPKDDYGMPYIVPIGMVLLENLVGFRLFIGTPNNYGNELWGGFEFNQITGSVEVETASVTQNTFVDYDPITGRAIRSALRQQLLIRVTSSPLFMSIATGQRICSPPSKLYSGSTGYGCWVYIPLLWYEDARVVNTEEFYRLNDHFYTRMSKLFFYLYNLFMLKQAALMISHILRL